MDTEEHESTKSLAELFDVECDAALIMGMSYREYWYDEPDIFYVTAKHYKALQEQAAQERDVSAWLTGQYVLSAISVNFAHAFGKAGHPKPKYPEMPLYVQEHDEQAQIKKRERDMLRSYNNFIAAAQAMGKLSNGAAS